MSSIKPIRTALVSVFNKERIGAIVTKLHSLGVQILTTGGTQHFIESMGIPCTAVEDLTGYPSILGGRVKTLHPKVFGGILARRENESDKADSEAYEIAPIDLVIVDLYPFEKTVASGASHADIIEKIDIGGISLIRAAAKNYEDVVIVPSEGEFDYLLDILERRGANSDIDERLYLARAAFAVSSGYDSAIYNWFAPQAGEPQALRVAVDGVKSLRYGENPHQQAAFYGDFNALFEQVHGKEISYNNLLDIDAACGLIDDLKGTAVAVLKHNNACGCAVDANVTEAWRKALAGDPVSAFGGIIITNTTIDATTAEEMGKIFFEVVIAPAYTEEALEILKQKKNRIILIRKSEANSATRMRSALGGVLVQASDSKVHDEADLKLVAGAEPTTQQLDDMYFANVLVKHSKSNAIVLARNGQLLASGVGQTSRVDALKQAIEKAHSFGFDLNGATLASDAFFPFADCVEIADKAGVTNVIQPGGSIRDNDSVEYCQQHNITMVMTGTRHFRH